MSGYDILGCSDHPYRRGGRAFCQRSVADISEALKAQKMFSSREWKRLYADGTVAKWLQQVSDFFMAEAGAKQSTPAVDYFDPALYLATIQ